MIDNIKATAHEYEKMGAHGTNDNVAIEICSDVDLTSCCKWSLCNFFSSFHVELNICLLLITSVFIMKYKNETPSKIDMIIK